MKDFKSEEERKQYIRDMDELMAIVNSGPKSNKLPHSDLILEEIVKSGKPGVKVGSKPAVSQNPSTHRSQQVPKYKIQKKKVKSRKKILIPPGLKKALLIALAGIGVVAIGATIANCLSKTGWVKGDPIEPPKKLQLLKSLVEKRKGMKVKHSLKMMMQLVIVKNIETIGLANI